MDAPEPSRLRRATYALLWVLAFTIPIQDVIELPGIGTISRLLGYVSLACAAAAVAAAGRVQLPRGPAVAAFAFLGWAIFSLLWTISEDATLQHLSMVARNVGMFWMFYEFLNDAQRIRHAAWAYVLGCWICVGGAIRSFATGNVRGGDDAWEARFVMADKDPNDMASLMAIGIPISLYLQARATRPLYRLALRLYAPCAIFAILLTGSRGGLLAAVVALLLQAATLSRRTLRAVIPAVVLLVIGLVLVQNYLPETLLNRFRALPGELRGGTFTNRRVIWQAGLEVLADRPLLGIGAGAYFTAISTRGGVPDTVAHNTALGILVEMGPAGVLTFLAVPLLIAWGARRLPPAERWLAWGMTATWITAASGLSWEANKTTWFTFGVLAAAVVRPWIFWSAPQAPPDARWDATTGDAT